MQSFSNSEFMKWAKVKNLTFLSQLSWPEAHKLVPANEMTTIIPTITTSHANLYTNKKEIFLAVFVVPDKQIPMIYVFKQLTSLK